MIPDQRQCLQTGFLDDSTHPPHTPRAETPPTIPPASNTVSPVYLSLHRLTSTVRGSNLLIPYSSAPTSAPERFLRDKTPTQPPPPLAGGAARTAPAKREIRTVVALALDRFDMVGLADAGRCGGGEGGWWWDREGGGGAARVVVGPRGIDRQDEVLPRGSWSLWKKATMFVVRISRRI